MKVTTIKVRELKAHKHHLEIFYGADNFSFSTLIFYGDVSLDELAEKHPASVLETVYSNIAFFEGMKFCSLYPERYDISAIAEGLSEDSLKLFYQIYEGVFAQHLYENSVTNYAGPEIVFEKGKLGNSQPARLSEQDSTTILSACGGGKDSILAMKMLGEANLPFSSFQHSRSVYGKADIQHQLISRLTKHVSPLKVHKISIYDDFMDCPFVKLYFPHLSGITAPETPTSIFEALVLMLGMGYRYLSLAHEKSANTGNLFSNMLGREVNHQWGKSYEAEISLNKYVRSHIFSDFHFFSILQPIYDFRIFKNLSKYPEVLPDIHSCNIQKPWCKRCAKCAYVWLGLMAFFEPKAVDSVFQSNLFDDEDLYPTFQQMLGLSEHTPFECIGEIDETRLAMKRCLDKGLQGKALELFKDKVLSNPSIEWESLERKYDTVYSTEHAIPDWIFSKIQSRL